MGQRSIRSREGFVAYMLRVEQVGRKNPDRELIEERVGTFFDTRIRDKDYNPEQIRALADAYSEGITTGTAAGRLQAGRAVYDAIRGVQLEEVSQKT